MVDQSVNPISPSTDVNLRHLPCRCVSWSSGSTRWTLGSGHLMCTRVRTMPAHRHCESTWIVFSVGYRTSATLKVFRSVVRWCGWKFPITLRLLSPGSGKLWRTVTTLEITSMVKIDFHVPRCPTCGHWILFNFFKVLHGPWFT